MTNISCGPNLGPFSFKHKVNFLSFVIVFNDQFYASRGKYLLYMPLARVIHAIFLLPIFRRCYEFTPPNRDKYFKWKVQVQRKCNVFEKHHREYYRTKTISLRQNIWNIQFLSFLKFSFKKRFYE